MKTYLLKNAPAVEPKAAPKTIRPPRLPKPGAHARTNNLQSFYGHMTNGSASFTKIMSHETVILLCSYPPCVSDRFVTS